MKPHLALLLLLAALAIYPASLVAAEPASRPFALAMTPHNFDDTREGTARMQQLLREHAEIVALYFEGGVPWPEAFEGKPFHANVQKELATLKLRIGPNHKVFLAISPVAFNRREMAPYWGSKRDMRRPGRWADKSFDDPEIVTAFGNYCERIIEFFHPDYLCYATEINMLAGANPKEFENVIKLAAQVYPRLKKAHPKLLVFPTIQRDYYFGPDDTTAKAFHRLLPFSDAVAVSTYPYMRGFTAATLPTDWFSSLRDMAPDKPFLVAETGFPADRYEGTWFDRPVTVAATPAMQRDYVRRLLTDARRLNAIFVNWFFAEDINAYLRPQSFVSVFFNLGLSDEKHQLRPAMHEWDTWRALPLKGAK